MKKIIIFALILFVSFSAMSEYAYIAVRNYKTNELGIIEYDADSKHYRHYSTNAYPIKDNVDNAQFVASCDGSDYFDICMIYDGKIETYKHNLYCSNLIIVIAYLNEYTYCLRENSFGNNEIIRLSPKGDIFVYSCPDESILFSGSATEITSNFPVVADVDIQGRILITSYASPETETFGLDSADGSYIYIYLFRFKNDIAFVI